MRGRDPDSGEFLGPSRSQRRRRALAVLELAERLAASSDAELAALPIPEGLIEPIRHARGIRARIARKREIQHLASLMRREDEAALEAIRAVLDRDKARTRERTARLHRVEAWRERLLTEGDAALAELLAAQPGLDRQRLRQLIHKARHERERDAPPHGQRELFRLLREALEPPSGPATGVAQPQTR